MSVRGYMEAVETVLESERILRRELIVFRPGARRGYEEIERDVPLPHMGSAVFSMALGAVMTGMHAVLDLRNEEDSVSLLTEAFSKLPQNACPSITMLIDAQQAALIPENNSVLRLCPEAPRQAAGFLRSALRSEGMTMLVLNEAYADIQEDVPDEDDFMLMPHEGSPRMENKEWENIASAALKAAYEADSAEIPKDVSLQAGESALQVEIGAAVREKTAEGKEEAMNDRQSAQTGHGVQMCATRMMRYDPGRLNEMAQELSAPAQKLMEKCVLHVYRRQGGFEYCCEEDAFDGECTFLPPEREAALIWIGCDMLSISYDSAQMEHNQARHLLSSVRRVLEKPSLLIYDREDEEA